MPWKRWHTLSLLIYLFALPGAAAFGQQRKFSLNAAAGTLISIGPKTFKETENGNWHYNWPYRLPGMRIRLGVDYDLLPKVKVGLQAGINQFYLEHSLDTYVNIVTFPIAAKIDYSFYKIGEHVFFVSADGGYHFRNRSAFTGGPLYTLAVGKRREIAKRVAFFYQAGFEHHKTIFKEKLQSGRDFRITLQTNMILLGMGFTFQ
jgi:hypothetical protein